MMLDSTAFAQTCAVVWRGPRHSKELQHSLLALQGPCHHELPVWVLVWL